jgi:hypothetical protein
MRFLNLKNSISLQLTTSRTHHIYELDPEYAQPATAAAAHTSYGNILTTSTSTPHDDDDDNDDLGLY